MLRGSIEALRAKAVAVQSAVSWSREFWRTMLDGLPAGCRLPLSNVPLEASRSTASTKAGLYTWASRPAAKHCQCSGGGSGCHMHCCLLLCCVPAGTRALLITFGRRLFRGDEGLVVVVTR